MCVYTYIYIHIHIYMVCHHEKPLMGDGAAQAPLQSQSQITMPQRYGDHFGSTQLSNKVDVPSGSQT